SHKTKTKVNTPSVTAQDSAAPPLGETTSRFAQIAKTAIWLSGRLEEGGSKCTGHKHSNKFRFSILQHFTQCEASSSLCFTRSDFREATAVQRCLPLPLTIVQQLLNHCSTPLPSAVSPLPQFSRSFSFVRQLTHVNISAIFYR
ncbi:MAG: hypothetical protein RR214_00770, partial [Synergistaceae bacterium]